MERGRRRRRRRKRKKKSGSEKKKSRAKRTRKTKRDQKRSDKKESPPIHLQILKAIVVTLAPREHKSLLGGRGEGGSRCKCEEEEISNIKYVNILILEHTYKE